jgi:L-seryl-tRNA(Ser) seleniumtransferase
LALSVRSPKKFLAQLRASHPSIIARIEDDRVLLDPRTVLDDEGLITVLSQRAQRG